MDSQSPAATSLAQFSEAQDAATLQFRANKQIADLAVANRDAFVVGFDAACMGGGATWLLGVFYDNCHMPPAVPKISVAVTQARIFVAEALDERTLVDAYALIKAAIALGAAPNDAPLITCWRTTGGGQGGKYLVAVLVDSNPQITPPVTPP
jgi:hypothetical protein